MESQVFMPAAYSLRTQDLIPESRTDPSPRSLRSILGPLPHVGDVLGQVGAWTMTQGPTGILVSDRDGAFPLGWVAQRCATSLGSRLHCRCQLRLGQVFILEDHGESWCLPHFNAALAVED